LRGCYATPVVDGHFALYRGLVADHDLIDDKLAALPVGNAQVERYGYGAQAVADDPAEDRA
jgi:hypothetical protein